MELVKLKDAIKLYQSDVTAPSNAYPWYRNSANKHGTVSIGDCDVPTHKKNGIWWVEKRKLDQALKSAHEHQRTITRITKDHDAGILHGKDGDTIQTTWGHYELHGNFRWVVSNHEKATGRSNGTWYCNKCNSPAKTEHEAPECHRCQDWGDCGRDCTLSRIYCELCGKTHKP